MDETPFVSAARALFQRTNLAELQWRHHGLGMLQAELTDVMRLHVWHPLLRVMQGLRSVHDHRFSITSAVLYGSITDVPYQVLMFDEGHEGLARGISVTHDVPVNHVLHAKIQSGTAADFERLGTSTVVEHPGVTHCAGAQYRIPRRVFHTTLVGDLAVTVIHRGDFDRDPARVLGNVGDVIEGNGAKTVSGIVGSFMASGAPPTASRVITMAMDAQEAAG